MKKVFYNYKMFRENSFSPDFEEFEFAGKKLYDDIEASGDSGHGRSTEMSGTHYTYRVFFIIKEPFIKTPCRVGQRYYPFRTYRIIALKES